MKRTRIAGVMTASTALALISTIPASAHEGSQVTSAKQAGPTLTRQAMFADLVVKQLDALQAKATALRVGVANVPRTTVLTAKQREAATHQYTYAKRLSKGLGALTGLTPAQTAQVAAIRASLDAAAGSLKVLLSNHPAADKVKIVTTDRVVTAADTTTADPRDRRCDHDNDATSGTNRASFNDGRDSSRRGHHHHHQR